MNVNLQKISVALAALGLITLLFAFLGVYDSDRMPFLQRLFFWGSTLSTGLVVGCLVVSWVFTGPLRNVNLTIQLIALSAIECLPVVLVLAAFSGGLSGAWPLYNWPLQYFLSFVIALVLNGVGYVVFKALGWDASVSKLKAQEQNTISVEQQFLQRLPAEYHQARLIAVTSEDHYLKVITDRGEPLILMRLVDAIRELQNIDGLQTHRSWWVARSGVIQVRSHNGKLSLTLQTGATVPVSRTFAAAVRAANYA